MLEEGVSGIVSAGLEDFVIVAEGSEAIQEALGVGSSAGSDEERGDGEFHGVN